MNNKQKTVEVIPSKSIWLGDDGASVNLVMYGDYESEACGKANEVVKKLIAEYPSDLRFNFRHFPLTRVHQHAQKAAEAAMSAAQHGLFWEMHDTLFANRRRLGTISLKSHALEVGVKDKRFLDGLVNSTYSWYVRDDLMDGLEKGVRDVPTFFINGVLYTGNPTFPGLSKAIAEAIKQQSKKKRA